MDSEGHQFLVLGYISGHKRLCNVYDVSDGFMIIQGGNNRPKNKTRGWELLAQMKEKFQSGYH